MERISKFRAFLLMGLFLLVLVLFSFKLFGLQVAETNTNISNVTTYSTITRVKAARGDITDRNGNILVGNRASYDLVFNHYVIISSSNTNESLVKLIDKCAELGVKYNDHFPVTRTRPFEYTLDNYSSAWRGYFQSFLSDDWCGLDSDITAPLLIQKLREVYKIPPEWSDEDARAVIGLRYELDLRNVTNLSSYIFIEDVSDEHLAVILELNVPGLMVEASTVREYHTRYAAHILGSVGAMDAKDWEFYEKQGYAMDAYIGQSGFEEAFELELHAVDGTRLDVVDKEGTIIKQYWANKYDENGQLIGQKVPQAGNNVETTLDLRLQQVAENSLLETLTLLKNKRDKDGDPVDGNDVQGAAVVAMDVRTGEVLVCASYPSYDPNDFFEKYEEMNADPLLPLYNRALYAEYPPGSTYKMVPTIAAINNGFININTPIYDEGIYDKYDNFEATCLKYSSTDGLETHGELTVRDALKVSCNYFFYEIGDRMQISQIDEVAKALGLGEPTGVEVPENTGVRSNVENKAAYYSGSDAEWFRGDQVMTAIGQAMNRFTPMQMCVYTSSLANKGVRYKATFLKRVVSDDYTALLKQNEPVVAATLEISDEAYQAYSEGMQLVASDEKGTAYETFGFTGYEIAVCAKTGTSEHDPSKSDHGAIVVYAPADDPEIAIAVYAEQGGHGSDMANIAKDILNAWFFNSDKAGDVTTDENRVS